MDDSWKDSSEFHERLVWARLKRTDFERPTDAAVSLGVKPGTYRTYEASKADGGRLPSLATVQKIARKYRVAWSWLLTGDGTPDDGSPDLIAVANNLAAQLQAVPEDKQEDARRAVEGVLAAFIRKAG